MGFYLRKSVRVGPLRFNLSKSGIGVSTGIPGLRAGIGPRGNYVHVGRGGLYYRATLSTPRSAAGDVNSFTPNGYQPTRPNTSDLTVGPEEAIDSGSVLQMTDESAGALLAELNSKRARWRLTPMVAILTLGATGLLWNSLTMPGHVATIIATAIGIFVSAQFDVLRKSTVIMYDLEDESGARYQRLSDAVQEIGKANALWHVETRAQVLDRKYHAGAGSEITRKPTAVVMGRPSFVKTNLDVPSLHAGTQTLYFFPDRLLVFASNGVGAIPYDSLLAERTTTRFIEEERVPNDSRIVDGTWRYVNKKGGPDRRFSNNRKIPICEYEALLLRSSSGLNELIHISRVGAGEALSNYLATKTQAQISDSGAKPST